MIRSAHRVFKMLASSSRPPLVPDNEEHANDHTSENAGQRWYTECGKLQYESPQEQDDREQCADSSPNRNLVNPDLYVPIFVGHLMNSAEGLSGLPFGEKRSVFELHASGLFGDVDVQRCSRKSAAMTSARCPASMRHFSTSRVASARLRA
jgi:hypothetical protein